MTEDTQGPLRQPPTRIRVATPMEAAKVDTRPMRPRHTRTRSSRKSESAVCDEATAAFVRRILCSQHQLRSSPAVDNVRSTPQPLDEILPPLTSSNEVDLQLYALIAIIVKDFIQTWYSKITPDHEFTGEVIQIIAHCTRGLEQRIRDVDLEALFFDEIPDLLDAHVTAYRTAHGGIYTSALGTNPRELYHAIQPHPALSPVPPESMTSTFPEQTENESIWRQLLVQGALSMLLPPEDLENPPLRVLVSEILSELILGKGVCGSVCEGWFMWETLTKLLVTARPETHPGVAAEGVGPATSRLEKFGLLSNEHAANLTGPSHGSTPDVVFHPTNSFTEIDEVFEADQLGINRLLSHHIHASILHPARIPSILLVVRTSLFPNNSLGPGRVPPTAHETTEIKRLCAAKIVDSIPEFVRGKLFTTRDDSAPAAVSQIEEMLDVFGDTYLNKHFVFALVDLIFLRLFPEMERQSVTSLLNRGMEGE
ncbi:hypothetical protein MBLNU459_g1646t2 [Dothideomycetes sp. NU459]